MTQRIWHLASLLVSGALLLAACAGPAATAPTPTAQPTVAAPATNIAQPTARPTEGVAEAPAASPTAARAQEAPSIEPAASPTAAQAEPPAEPVAVPAALPLAEGEVVLQLSPGAGEGQVGIGSSPDSIAGPRSFRIGSDGSIRLLDNANQRILFFNPDGNFERTLTIAEASDPMDFIVNTEGEVFVYDRYGEPPQVLRYAPDGKLAERLPISSGVSVNANGIMLTADQDLLLIQDNQTYWTLTRKGIVVAPEIQPLTRQDGTATPRSPTRFQTVAGEGGRPELRVIGLTGGVTGDTMGEVTRVPLNLPADARFFNVDRAMDLYFTRTTAEELELWRVSPNGLIAGGARVSVAGCQSSWRTSYVDQAGTAWAMCATHQGVTITRYTLLDPAGQPLPEAAQVAADVMWKPGARLDAA